MKIAILKLTTSPDVSDEELPVIFCLKFLLQGVDQVQAFNDCWAVCGYNLMKADGEHPIIAPFQDSEVTYPLVMTNSLPWYRWPIEIDDFPSDINLHLFLGFSMAMLVITR